MGLFSLTLATIAASASSQCILEAIKTGHYHDSFFYFDVWVRKTTEDGFDRFESGKIRKQVGLWEIAKVVRAAFGSSVRVSTVEDYFNLQARGRSDALYIYISSSHSWFSARSLCGEISNGTIDVALHSRAKGKCMLLLGPGNSTSLTYTALLEPKKHCPVMLWTGSDTVDVESFVSFVRKHQILAQQKGLERYFVDEHPLVPNVLLQECVSNEVVSITNANYVNASPEEIFLLWHGLLKHLKADTAVAKALRVLLPNCNIVVSSAEKGDRDYIKEPRMLPYKIDVLPRTTLLHRHLVPIFHYFEPHQAFMLCHNLQSNSFGHVTTSQRGFIIPSLSHPQCVLLVYPGQLQRKHSDVARGRLLRKAGVLSMTRAEIHDAAKCGHKYLSENRNW